ncbi:DUF7916 family protein [Bacillus sp. AK031]
MKRLLDCTASDFLQMNGIQLKKSIIASEGRVILAEVIASCTPYYPTITNAELASAFGADMILLNFFDVFHPCIEGLSSGPSETIIYQLKELTGCPIGVNLEPVDPSAEKLEALSSISKGRIATKETLTKAKKLGFDFVCLTGNPKTGVSNLEINKSITLARGILGNDGLIFAGKMHGAGVAGETGRRVMTEEVVTSFIDSGADVVLVPSPGTVPGFSVEKSASLIETIHHHGGLAITTIGTSQEGADPDTIKTLALSSKMAGADLFHIGDAGIAGMADPENILAFSVAVRGKRHTYVRMAQSVLR